MRRKYLGIFTALCALLVALTSTAGAQSGGKPFILPMADPPGPSTWLLGQPYGNTVGAFLRGADWYEAGQRLHFGLDFTMPCGTPLIAMADGEVIFVDDRGFGSGPHNLLIRHEQTGLITLYGHLLERPQLEPGQRVQQGQVIALSGDPDETCDSRPHLHLEVRSLNYFTAYNPIDFIDANWHTLAAIGGFSYPFFQQDLDHPRRWMSLDDQPIVNFGGAPLNNYAAPYPDRRTGAAPANPPLMRDLGPLSAGVTLSLRRLAFDGCCPGAWWHPTDAGRLYVIDGNDGQRAAVFEWDTIQGGPVQVIGQAPPPPLSPDGTHEVNPSDNGALIRRLADNVEWRVETGGATPAISADNSWLLWHAARPDAEGTEIRVSAIDGTGGRPIVAVEGGSAMWLDGSRLLISSRERITTTLTVYDSVADSTFVLGAWDWVRGLTIAPGGGRLMFYRVFSDDSCEDGVYTIETQPGAAAQRLSWFGAWRWRDAHSVYYLPLDSSSDRHTVRYYHISSGDDRLLTDPAAGSFAVANGDWSVSPDGQQIAFWNAADFTLWLLEMTGS